MLTCELVDSLERSRRRAARARLQAFERSERIRQTAAAKRQAAEINALAHQTYKAILVAAVEARRKASSGPGK